VSASSETHRERRRAFSDKCTVIHEEVLLSLAGVRIEDRTKFPVRYRSNLSTAKATFKKDNAETRRAEKGEGRRQEQRRIQRGRGTLVLVGMMLVGYRRLQGVRAELKM